MLRVRLRYAEPGMVIAETVRHPRHPGVLLLKPGARLDEPAIARLLELRVPELWIRYPALEGLRRYHAPAVSQARDEAARRIAGALDALVADRHARLDYVAFRTVTTGLLAAVSDSPLAALFISEQAAIGSAAARHAATTCFLSILLGLKLDSYIVRERARLCPGVAQDVTSLGLGAMLHDVGLTALDDATLRRFAAAGDEDDPAWQAHVRVGFDMVKEEFDPAVAACVLHHHQRFDGTGFPRRRALDASSHAVAGAEIHVFARIVAVAEYFDRLRYPEHSPDARPADAPALPTARALKRVLQASHAPAGSSGGASGGRFDPKIVRALLCVVPPYAPGSIVRLSDSRQGVVSDWSPRHPCRCTVEILDPRGRQRGRPWWTEAPVERVDLAQRPDLRVVEAEGHDVSGDEFEVPAPASPARPGGDLDPPAGAPACAARLPHGARPPAPRGGVPPSERGHWKRSQGRHRGHGGRDHGDA